MSPPTPSALSRRLVVLCAGLALLGAPARAAAIDNGLARTPYMGWNSYYAFSGNFNEAAVTSTADAFLARGFKAAGYRYVWLDAGWRTHERDKRGGIRVDRRSWPHGMAWIVAYVHARGLLAGIYTDAGRDGCGLPSGGSYGHYAQDVNTFAAWGYDAVKVDFCGGERIGLNPVRAYNQFATAVKRNSSHRPLLLNVCNFYEPGEFGRANPSYQRSAFFSYAFAPPIANSWRTGTDLGYPGHVDFSEVLRNIDADASHPTAAGPGHWNDPDYLTPDQGMTPGETQAQFTMWAELAAPLMLSDDIRSMPPTTLAAVTNRDVIAVDQDPLGAQGVRVSQQGDGDVWSKLLSDGSRAVVLLNRSPTALAITTSAAAVGLSPSPAGYTLRDIWTGRSSATAGSILASVPGHSALMYRVSAR